MNREWIDGDFDNRFGTSGRMQIESRGLLLYMRWHPFEYSHSHDKLYIYMTTAELYTCQGCVEIQSRAFVSPQSTNLKYAYYRQEI